MRPLAGAVRRALRVLHLESGVDRATAIDAWPAAAVAVLGPAALAVSAIRVDDRTLVILVPDTGWAGEIRLRERELIIALQERAPRSGVARIRSAPTDHPTGPASGDGRR